MTFLSRSTLSASTVARRVVLFHARHGGLRALPRAAWKIHLGATSQLVGSVSLYSSSRNPPPGGNRVAGTLGVLGTGALVLWGKGKYILAALKLTKFASLASMFVSVWAYSMFFGLPFAAGMVGLILVHETGHALVMYKRGIEFSPMVFVPFVGAAISMNRAPHDAWEEALVAFGGPALGSLAAIGCSVAGYASDSQFFYALADFGYMVNLFNMLPVGMMDGGRIAGALSPYAGVAGLGFGGYLAYSGFIHNPIFYIILLAGGWEIGHRFMYPGSIPRNYHKISPIRRLTLTGGYVGLVGALFAAMAVNNEFKKPPEVLEREKKWDSTEW